MDLFLSAAKRELWPLRPSFMMKLESLHSLKKEKNERDAAAMCVYVRWWARRPISNIYDVFLRNHSTLKNVHCVHRFIGRHFSLAQGT